MSNIDSIRAELAELGEDNADEDAGPDKKLTHRDRVIMIGEEADELWHDADGKTYATIEVDEHLEHHLLRSTIFRRWLILKYAERFQVPGRGGKRRPTAPTTQTINDGLNVLEAMAWQGQQHEPNVRVAERKGHVYIDLGTPNWAAIKVTRNGWRVVTKPLVKFVRPNGLRPLPIPEEGGDIEMLRPFVNVSSDDDFRLVVGWLVGALAPRGPYPILVVNGEEGSTKSTLCRVLRRLIDPNKAELRSAPRDERDLVLAANHGHVVAIDNQSFIKGNLSDAMCRIATGAGFATRSLYTNEKETIIQVCRPQLVNGIPDLATRSDFAGRSIVLTLSKLEPGKRKLEAHFWDDFDQDAPLILGALCDAVSCAMDNFETVTLSSTPRMADFARWVEAAAPDLGWKSGEFLLAYERNRAAAVEVFVEADIVATAVKKLIDRRAKWTGTATRLLKALNDIVDEDTKRLNTWPKSASHVSNRLRRAAPALRELGVDVSMNRRKGASHIALRKRAQNAATAATRATKAGGKSKPSRGRGARR